MNNLFKEYCCVVEKVYKDLSVKPDIEMCRHTYIAPPVSATMEYETYTKYIHVFKSEEECEQYYVSCHALLGIIPEDEPVEFEDVELEDDEETDFVKVYYQTRGQGMYAHWLNVYYYGSKIGDKYLMTIAKNHVDEIRREFES